MIYPILVFQGSSNDAAIFMTFSISMGPIAFFVALFIRGLADLTSLHGAEINGAENIISF